MIGSSCIKLAAKAFMTNYSDLDCRNSGCCIGNEAALGDSATLLHLRPPPPSFAATAPISASPPLNASAHKKRVLASSGNFSLVCRICSKEFSTGRALGGHMRIHGGINDSILSSAPEKEVRAVVELGSNDRLALHRDDINKERIWNSSEFQEARTRHLELDSRRNVFGNDLQDEANVPSTGILVLNDDDTSAEDQKLVDRGNEFKMKIAKSRYTDLAIDVSQSKKKVLQAAADAVYVQQQQAYHVHHRRSIHMRSKPLQEVLNRESSSLSLPAPDTRISTNDIITSPASGASCRSCPVCSKIFSSSKAVFGHMRCHPEREWRGITPPPPPPCSSSATDSAAPNVQSHHVNLNVAACKRLKLAFADAALDDNHHVRNCKNSPSTSTSTTSERKSPVFPIADVDVQSSKVDSADLCVPSISMNGDRVLIADTDEALSGMGIASSNCRFRSVAPRPTGRRSSGRRQRKLAAEAYRRQLQHHNQEEEVTEVEVKKPEKLHAILVEALPSADEEQHETASDVNNVECGSIGEQTTDVDSIASAGEPISDSDTHTSDIITSTRLTQPITSNCTAGARNQMDVDQVAKCLLLLSNSNNIEKRRSTSTFAAAIVCMAAVSAAPAAAADEREAEEPQNCCSKVDDGGMRSERDAEDSKMSSRRDMHEGGSTAAVVRDKVSAMENYYACTICNKSFNNPQALGGHRASHQKKKNSKKKKDDMDGECVAKDMENARACIKSDEISDSEWRPTNNIITQGAAEHYSGARTAPVGSENWNEVCRTHELGPRQSWIRSSSTSTEAANINMSATNGNEQQAAPAVGVDFAAPIIASHRCSVCDRRFLTGQALGGHKRCHWNNAATTTTTSTSTTGITGAQQASHSNTISVRLSSSSSSSNSSKYDKKQYCAHLPSPPFTLSLLHPPCYDHCRRNDVARIQLPAPAPGMLHINGGYFAGLDLNLPAPLDDDHDPEQQQHMMATGSIAPARESRIQSNGDTFSIVKPT